MAMADNFPIKCPTIFANMYNFLNKLASPSKVHIHPNQPPGRPHTLNFKVFNLIIGNIIIIFINFELYLKCIHIKTTPIQAQCFNALSILDIFLHRIGNIIK